MADKVKVKLLRPLNGAEVGSSAEYDAGDAKRLEASGAVQIVAKAAAPAAETKMEATPQNKSAPARTTRKGK